MKTVHASNNDEGGAMRSTTTMKAVVQDGYGAPERVLKLAEIDRPTIGADEVLIRVRATSVNTPDWITVSGEPYLLRFESGIRGPRRQIRGTDIAGTIEAVGSNVEDLQSGDSVFGSTWNGALATSGTFAEYAAVPASQVAKKPANLSFEDAAASVMSGLTALIAQREVQEAEGAKEADVTCRQYTGAGWKIASDPEIVGSPGDVSGVTAELVWHGDEGFTTTAVCRATLIDEAGDEVRSGSGRVEPLWRPSELKDYPYRVEVFVSTRGESVDAQQIGEFNCESL